MLEKKRLQSLRRRILKDQRTLSCMGAVGLSFEFGTLSLEDLKQLKEFIESHRNPTSYKSLNETIERKEA